MKAGMLTRIFKDGRTISMANESTPTPPTPPEGEAPPGVSSPGEASPHIIADAAGRLAASVDEQQKTGLRFFHFGHLATPGEVKVFQHSRIFYWWPVWFFGFVFAGLSYFGGWQLAHVPEGTKIEERDGRFHVVMPEQAKMPTRYNAQTQSQELIQPIAHVSKYRGLGTLYCALLLLVVIFTTMTFRGIMSLYLTIVFFFLCVIFYLAGWWDVIFDRIGQLAVFISAGGYMIIAVVMFVLWIVNLVLLDKQTYMVFTPGQVRVRLEFGGGETIYSAKGVSLHKLRGDFFRHWVLGLGSGDIEVHVQNVPRPLELHNVLNANQAIRAIERTVQEQEVITQKEQPTTKP
jgi:hypothetical protein